MNQQRLMKVIVGPHVSEKVSIVGDKANLVAFKVRRDANKLDIKHAVELMFNVDVKNVSVANMKGKEKRFGSSIGRRQDWKKAYVTLAEGQDINFAGAE